jgi:hypothetical protein
MWNLAVRFLNMLTKAENVLDQDKAGKWLTDE